MAVDLETSDYFRDFDWGNLKAFYYVAKVGNISGAAHFLKLSQPAMSRQISKLEKHLGYPLFTRNRGGVKLTRKGEELLNIVESIFIELKGYTHNNHSIEKKEGKRKIRIATTHALAAYVINDLILDYNKDHPEFIFELTSNDHLIDVIMNDVDIAIRPYDSAAQSVIQEPLFTLQKKLYASIEYLEKYGEPQSIEDLHKHSIIAPANSEEYPYADVNWILKIGATKGAQLEAVYTSDAIECLIDAAKRGIGIIGGYECMKILKNANLKNILPDISENKVKLYFIYPKFKKDDKDIINLYKHLTSILTTNC